MQFTLIALGSRGDVQPYLALGVGLKQNGHEVRILASDDFEQLIVGSGLRFFSAGGSVEGVAQEMQALLEQGNFLKILASMGAPAERMAGAAAANGIPACEGSDKIIAGLGGLFLGLALSEKTGAPCIPAFVYPFTPTREFSSVLTPLPQTTLTTWANPLTHRMAQQMIWQTFRGADTRLRRDVLRMKPSPFWGPFDRLQKSTILNGYSPSAIPTPRDWGGNIHVTGYWFLDPPSGWTPPDDLARFLEAGPPPVYIGFGSMTQRKPEEALRMILDALALSGQRGVISAGWGGIQSANLPDGAFLLGSIPHGWLFPRMAAVVHHGGGGTTAAGLRAGIPALVTPFMGDQPYWAGRVYALGVGPKPIPRRELTATCMADAIRQAVSDTAMREKAAALGERVRAENGVANAVAILERAVMPIKPGA